MRILTGLLISLTLIACAPEVKTKDTLTGFEKSPACTLMLVAYKTSKHSKYYMQEVGTLNLFYFTGLGGRRIPTIPLGGTVQSRCDYGEKGNRITEFHYYSTSIVKHTSGTVIRSLKGYEYLFE